MVVFLNQDNLTKLDNIINISQSVLLPFALIPLLKFVSNYKVMDEFTLQGFPLYFAVGFGIALFSMNFTLLFIEETSFESW